MQGQFLSSVTSCAYIWVNLVVSIDILNSFTQSGRKRMQQANDAIAELTGRVDTLIVVSNDKLLNIVPENTPLQEAFLVADDVLRQVRCLIWVGDYLFSQHTPDSL